MVVMKKNLCLHNNCKNQKWLWCQIRFRVFFFTIHSTESEDTKQTTKPQALGKPKISRKMKSNKFFFAKVLITWSLHNGATAETKESAIATSTDPPHSNSRSIRVIFSLRWTHFMLLISFYILWKHQKTIGFMFSGGIERNQWYEMG